MATNPYEPPQSIPANQVRPQPWKWRFILPLVAFALLTMINVFAHINGFSLRFTTDKMTDFDHFISCLNFPGIYLAMFDPTPHDNLMSYLLYAGGVIAWTLLAFVIGTIADIVRRMHGE